MFSQKPTLVVPFATDFAPAVQLRERPPLPKIAGIGESDCAVF